MDDIQYDLFGNPVTNARTSRPAGVPGTLSTAVGPVGAAPTSGAAMTESPNLREPDGADVDVRASATASTVAPTAAPPSLAVPGTGAVSAVPGPTTIPAPMAAKGRRPPTTKPSAPSADELAEGQALVALIEAMLEAARAKLRQRAGLLSIPTRRIDGPVLAAAAAKAIEQPTLIAQLRLILPRRNGAGGDGVATRDAATGAATTHEPVVAEDSHADAEGADDDPLLSAEDDTRMAAEA